MSVISLQDLQEQAKVTQRHIDDRPDFFTNQDALRARINTGYEKVKAYRAEHGLDGANDPTLVKAEAKLKELEAELALHEKAIEIPWYLSDALLMIARDALKWSCVPKDSVVLVKLPGVFTLEVRLDNLPLEPPF